MVTFLIGVAVGTFIPTPYQAAIHAVVKKAWTWFTSLTKS
jgi:hypothetical protein